MIFKADYAKSACVDWIRKFFKVLIGEEPKNAIVGISGGKDSTVVAGLLVEALGKDRVIGVLMPNGEQSDLDDAKEIVRSLGIRNYIVNIYDIMGTFYNTIIPIDKFPGYHENVYINSPARIRMTILYAYAAVFNGYVANTCNASENYIGYSTKFGDSAGDFAPIHDFTVKEVKQIGSLLPIDQRFINKTPEDGLSGKTDEEKTGIPYDVLDDYIETGICEDEKIKNKIDAMWRASRHKVINIPHYSYPRMARTIR